MSIQEVSPEQFARLFHHYQEALAPDFGCADGSHPDSWSEVPLGERRRMVTAARLALLELASSTDTDEENGRRRYFATPGQAEWGC
jgi:hypothetical protein